MIERAVLTLSGVRAPRGGQPPGGGEGAAGEGAGHADQPHAQAGEPGGEPAKSRYGVHGSRLVLKSFFSHASPLGIDAAVAGADLGGPAAGPAEVLQPVAERRPESTGG